jgi:hypothetical protein
VLSGGTPTAAQDVKLAKGRFKIIRWYKDEGIS